MHRKSKFLVEVHEKSLYLNAAVSFVIARRFITLLMKKYGTKQFLKLINTPTNVPGSNFMTNYLHFSTFKNISTYRIAFLN